MEAILLPLRIRDRVMGQERSEAMFRHRAWGLRLTTRHLAEQYMSPLRPTVPVSEARHTPCMGAEVTTRIADAMSEGGKAAGRLAAFMVPVKR